MTPVAWNWKSLAPHRPLSDFDGTDAALYVPRVNEGAQPIVDVLGQDDGRLIALSGPAGSGKSTELRALARRLSSDFEAATALIEVDRALVFEAATSPQHIMLTIADQVMQSPVVAEHLALNAAEDALSLSPDLKAADHSRVPPQLHLAVCQLRQAAGQGVSVLLLDGLEKVVDALAYQVLMGMRDLTPDVRVVAVCPVGVAEGALAHAASQIQAPGAEIVSIAGDTRETLALEGYCLVPLGAVLVDESLAQGRAPPDAAEHGIAFLKRVACQRLQPPGGGLPAEIETVLRHAALMSGGLIRTFLQLLQKAAAYANMTGRENPTLRDLTCAANDQTEDLVRLLEPGDAEVLRGAHAIRADRIEFARRIRLLSHGLLLYYPTAGGLASKAPLLPPHRGPWAEADPRG